MLIHSHIMLTSIVILHNLKQFNLWEVRKGRKIPLHVKTRNLLLFSLLLYFFFFVSDNVYYIYSWLFREFIWLHFIHCLDASLNEWSYELLLFLLILFSFIRHHLTSYIIATSYKVSNRTILLQFSTKRAHRNNTF